MKTKESKEAALGNGLLTGKGRERCGLDEFCELSARFLQISPVL